MDNKHGKQTNVQTLYETNPERIFNEARNAETIIVLAVKGGEPVLWANGDERQSQELLAQFFPSAVLPRTMAGAGSDR